MKQATKLELKNAADLVRDWGDRLIAELDKLKLPKQASGVLTQFKQAMDNYDFRTGRR